MPSPAPAPACIARLASDRRVHQAFQWLHLQEQRILQWQTELVGVPAPPFGEAPRARWLCDRFRDLGLEEPRIDSVGNAIARIGGTDPAPRRILLSAHIDTVFPAGTAIDPELNGSRLSAPGACDNGAGVAALLAIAAALRTVELSTPCTLEFIGNVGEEGEGDLRGIRQIYRAGTRDNIAAHLVLDGAGHEAAVTHALGSQRYRVTVTGPGGHSWTDAGRPNPIVILSQAIQRFAAVSVPDSPRTTINVGTVEGGTAINAIPQQASARFDLRSTDPEQLIRLEVELHRAVEDAVLSANQTANLAANPSIAVRFEIRKIGDRPAGRLPANSRLMTLLEAVDRHLSIRTEPRLASTDANIPLSLGIPAVSIGGGGEGGGIHTYGEWYDARGRDLGLRRILLLLLAMAGC
ncbi:MAG TPA: M20/M25/M40 family metallo-hydrolase [Acidobacteriaceae bacterium]|jgi:acetylornithine deacetylase/succinyl-diaminopimelate desuccinylase-like protein|nr:M20/M25/M40 family metallo-hydrolase [Acidobacteriaceae bacterium]